MTHICVSKQTIIGSENGLSPGRRQAIIWTNAGVLLIGTLGTNFNEILIEIRKFSFKKMGLNVSFAKWQSFCLGLNVLKHSPESNFTRSTCECNMFGGYNFFKIITTAPRVQWVSTLRLGQNGQHFPDNIFKCIFLNENVWISIKISLNFVPKGPVNNILALVQIMAWGWPGDKPLSKPMMVRLLTHIYITRPQWVNGFTPIQNIKIWGKMPPKWIHMPQTPGHFYVMLYL